ncbi:MAG: hypothetical protein ACK5TH_18525, partial [Prosthecobacter sp.]
MNDQLSVEYIAVRWVVWSENTDAIANNAARARTREDSSRLQQKRPPGVDCQNRTRIEGDRIDVLRSRSAGCQCTG